MRRVGDCAERQRFNRLGRFKPDRKHSGHGQLNQQWFPERPRRYGQHRSEFAEQFQPAEQLTQQHNFTEQL